jgi:hypothetical protein
MILVTISCENCLNKVDVKVKKLSEVKGALQKLGWLKFINLVLCPDCRKTKTV